jgi:hypothetical protein
MKLAALVRAFMASKMEADLNELLYRMPVPQMTQKEKSECYGRMLSVLMDDPSGVSYATGNPMHLDQVAPVDVLLFTMFAFVMCARIRGDNPLQLGCVGMSTCDKSMLIEAPIQATGTAALVGLGCTWGCGIYGTHQETSCKMHRLLAKFYAAVNAQRQQQQQPSELYVHALHWYGLASHLDHLGHSRLDQGRKGDACGSCGSSGGRR